MLEEETKIEPLYGSIINTITLVDILVRETKSSFKATSLPGHLIQYVLEGEVEQNSNGQDQYITPGKIIWYHENETVKGRIIKAPWRYYTINFIAPLLSPPMYNQRVIEGNQDILEGFRKLHEVWHNTLLPPTFRHLQLHALLLHWLIKIIPSENLHNRIDTSTQIWWEIEELIHKDLSIPYDLNTLVKISNRSKRTVIRSCHQATNTSPIKRLKEVRLSYAQGLVRHSRRSITDIAFMIAYPRVQEFSRDYRLRFGITPSQDRKTGPQYKKLQVDS
jgi:AraC-like DNA-binding protein